MTRFCPYCETDREVRHEERTETYTVRGEQIKVLVPATVCALCGTALSDERQDAEIASAVYRTYRSRHGLLSPDEIKAIRNRYSLSQKALAALLGMSEATINRYEGGAIPEKTHNNLLILAASPRNMKVLFEKNGNILVGNQLQRFTEALERALSASAASSTIGNFCVDSHVLKQRHFLPWSISVIAVDSGENCVLGQSRGGEIVTRVFMRDGDSIKCEGIGHVPVAFRREHLLFRGGAVELGPCGIDGLMTLHSANKNVVRT